MICPRCQSDINKSNKSRQYNEATSRACIVCPNCGAKFIIDYAPYAAISAGAGAIAVAMAILNLTTTVKIWLGATILFFSDKDKGSNLSLTTLFSAVIIRLCPDL